MPQIEILGVSLPWRGVFTNEGHGARLTELSKNFQKDTHTFLSSLDTNPFLGTSLPNESLSTSVQQGGSANNLVDLLSGEDMFSESVSLPVTKNAIYEGGDLLDFLDQTYVDADTDHKSSSSHDGRTPDSFAQKYINFLKSLAGQHMVCYYLLHVALSYYVFSSSSFI